MRKSYDKILKTLETYSNSLNITIADLKVLLVYHRPEIEYFDWDNKDTYKVINQKITKYGFHNIVNCNDIKCLHQYFSWLISQSPKSASETLKELKQKDLIKT